jgi:hypothetical protein
LAIGAALHDLTRGFELLDGHVRQADVADRILCPEFGEDADQVLEWGIRRPAAVEEIEVDGCQTESAQPSEELADARARSICAHVLELIEL